MSSFSRVSYFDTAIHDMKLERSFQKSFLKKNHNHSKCCIRITTIEHVMDTLCYFRVELKESEQGCICMHPMDTFNQERCQRDGSGVGGGGGEGEGGGQIRDYHMPTKKRTKIERHQLNGRTKIY